MMIVLMIVLFLAVLIVPLRGPSTKKNSQFKPNKPKDFSQYVVNEDGRLEMADEDSPNQR
jgi:hypothetical protein